MTRDMRYFLYLFIEIRKKGFIPNVKSTKNGAGVTFEHCLNKTSDSLPFPDFKGIEVKVKSKTSKYNMTLCCIEPDMLFDTYKLACNYGYLPKNKELKYFYVEVNATQKTQFMYNYFKLSVDYENKRISLLIYDAKDNIVNNDVTWDFKTIKERFLTKLNILALINYERKIMDNKEYYFYKSLDFYKDINFDKIISAIENGIITLKFTINVNMTTNDINNHGTRFLISKENIHMIYDTKF